MPETLSRIINVFPVAERLQVTVTLLASLRLVISQRLVPLPDNSGRTALREYLAFTPTIRERLLDTPLERLIPQAEILLDEYGQRIQDAAEPRLCRRAHRQGELSGHSGGTQKTGGQSMMTGDILWRDTGITPKILVLDARAVFPLLLWLFHWAWWTASLAMLGIIGLYLVQRTGMSPLACLRAIRTAIMGRRRETRYSETLWRKRCRW